MFVFDTFLLPACYGRSAIPILEKGETTMKVRNISMLGLILALLLSASMTTAGFAKAAEVPFHAYYPVWATMVLDTSCNCNVQTFTPGGIVDVMHLGASQFSGEAKVFPPPPPPPMQKGTGTLTAANGDELYVKYEGIVTPVANNPGHVVANGTFTFEGGTGRFEDASGGGTYHVFAHVHPFPEAPNDLWFDGTLIK
jgi:hypothetical protein